MEGTLRKRRQAPQVLRSFAPTRLEDDVLAGVYQRLLSVHDRLAALEATFSLIRDAQDFRLVKRGEALEGRPDPGSYFALTAEIERLQGVAEAARNVEASQAISWIRRAIETYALTRDDIGI